MFHGGAEYYTERVKCSEEVLNDPRQMFHGEGQMVHGGGIFCTDNAKYSTEVLNIPRRGSNVPQRC